MTKSRHIGPYRMLLAPFELSFSSPSTLAIPSEEKNGLSEAHGVWIAGSSSVKSVGIHQFFFSDRYDSAGAEKQFLESLGLVRSGNDSQFLRHICRNADADAVKRFAKEGDSALLALSFRSDDSLVVVLLNMKEGWLDDGTADHSLDNYLALNLIAP